MATLPTDDQLLKQAELGKLPFDIFALENWDYARPIEQDQEQWDSLAQEWLDLDARGRHPYHCDDEALPRIATATADHMNRVLVPHQTVRERNLSTRTGSAHRSPVWLRTCYCPELASVYTKWCIDLEYELGHWAWVLDDEALYAPFAFNWSRVLLRVPAIADAVRYTYEDDGNLWDPREDCEPPGQDEEFKKMFYEAMVKEKTMLFLVDEEALRDELIKVLWLDINGACVWDNRLRPSQMLSFRGQIFDSGGSLAALYENFPDDPGLYKRGLLLTID
ncbi:hypothetical protein F4860DRAFT_426685 [Xylaria cubensis]|nr:hypothetical protein F4860DRAFT_426685 [Xylaria cubensis]